MKDLRTAPILLIVFLGCALVPAHVASQQYSPAVDQPAWQQPVPQFDNWGDDFSSSGLDETKWERFSFEGGGGKLEVKNGQLQLRSANRTRAGVRSKLAFTGDRFSVEARVAKSGPSCPNPATGPLRSASPH
jgi:hypothetical protein